MHLRSRWFSYLRRKRFTRYEQWTLPTSVTTMPTKFGYNTVTVSSFRIYASCFAAMMWPRGAYTEMLIDRFSLVHAHYCAVNCMHEPKYGCLQTNDRSKCYQFLTAHTTLCKPNILQNHTNSRSNTAIDTEYNFTSVSILGVWFK